MHCDNPGEDVALKKTFKQDGMGMEIKFTAPDTPQQKGQVEQEFATLFNLLCAMLNGGKFTTFLKNGLSPKAANTTMLLKNNLITPNRNVRAFQQFLEGKEKHPVFGTNIWWNMYHHLQG